MDKEAGSRRKSQSAIKPLKLHAYYFIFSLAILCLVPCALRKDAHGADKWPGVDEAVVEKISREHGRESRDSLINTDQGDLLLFAFLLAGAAGGFAAGYYWRVLLEGKVKRG